MHRFMPRLLALAVAQTSIGLAAAEIPSPSRPVEHVLVTMPLHKESAETALPFTVFRGDELRRAASATIGDTLGNTPGISNASFGPGVGQPVIRGQQGPRVRVLQNGTSSADAARASQDHANSVEALLADSIEVLRGPSTLLYGGGAIGGVINVIDSRIPTKLPEDTSGGLSYRHDTASNMDVVVGRLDAGTGNFALHVDGMIRDFDDLEIPGEAELAHSEHGADDDHAEEHDDHDEEGRPGILGNTAGEASSLTLGGSYHFDSGFVGLSVNHLENEYGIPTGSHSDEGEGEGEEEEEEEEHGDIALEVEQTRYDAVLHWHEIAPYVDVARVFLTYTDYEHAEIEGDGEVGTLYGSDSLEGRAEIVHQNIAGFDGVVGLQISSGEFSALGEEAFIPVTDYREVGIFLVEDYHAGDWVFEFGLRYDSDERDPQSLSGSERFSSVSGSAAALWELTESWQIGLAASRAERAPSLEELYSNVGNDVGSLVLHAATDAYEVGDTDLDTEVSRNLDLSLRWQLGENRASLQLYYNDFARYINLMNTGQRIGDSPILAYSQEDAQFVGVEFDSEFALASLASGTVLFGVFGDVTRGEFDSGADVPRLPPIRVGAKLSWARDNFELWTRVLSASEQGKPGENETETPSYTKWDAGVEYLAPLGDRDLRIYLTASNITDEDIRLSTSFLRNVAPEAGFGLQAGVALRF